MRVAVECQSPLLQKSLELFLTNYLSSSKKCDIIVRDEECLEDKRCFYVASDAKADLMKPFSKSQLIVALEKRYNELYPKKQEKLNEKEDELIQDEYGMDFSILQKRIEQLTQEYQTNILRAVKAFYEK
ncbi:hypothetical protein [Sulfurimonas sp.]